MSRERGTTGGKFFPATRWTLIRSAQARPETRREAMGEMLRDYWKPLYCLAKRRGMNSQDAEDAVQGFVTRLLEGDVIARLNPHAGRLRSYLRTSFEHFLINLYAREYATKRGKGAKAIPIDASLAERLADPSDSRPEDVFDRVWAVEVFSRALNRLRDEYEVDGHTLVAEIVLRHFRPDQSPPSYEATASSLGVSIPQIKSFLHRARLRFRRIVRDEVADTVADGADVDEEVHELVRVLAR